MALNSPGVEVTVIDQSQYLPAAPASVPLIIMATAQNKANASGTGIAPGTVAANANKLYRVTSQRDLVTLFGNPFIYKTTNGTPIQGYELNEYGLLAAYSTLGSTNLCYVIRANIDTASLVGRTGRPSAPPVDGTYWLDTTQSTWGIFEFNLSTGAFTTKTPIIIEDTKDVAAANGRPQQYIGNIGDYATVLVTKYGAPTSYSTYWFKNKDNVWVSVGGSEWKSSWPTVQGNANVSPTAVLSGEIIINGVTIPVPPAPSNTVQGLVGAINANLFIPFITAGYVNGRLEIYSSNDEQLVVSGTTQLLADLSVTAGTYYSPAISYGTNAQQPLWRTTDATPHPTGSVWIKTNSANLGINLVTSQYNALTGTFTARNCPLSLNDWSINAAIDSTGGQSIAAGSIYAQYEADNIKNAPIQLYRRSSAGASSFVGVVSNPTFTPGLSFTVSVSSPGSSSLSAPRTVTLPSSGTIGADAFVTAWTTAGIPNTTATVSATGQIVLTHVLGGVIILNDQALPGTPSAVNEAGFRINDPASPVTGTVGAKWGPFKDQVYTGLSTTVVSGAGNGGLTINMTTRGRKVISATVVSGGLGYAVGDEMEVADGAPASSAYRFVVTTISSGGVVTGIQWDNGFASPAYTVQLSNWQIFEYQINDVSPVQTPVNGTNWFYSVVDQVDIMTNVAGEWKGYRNVSFGNNGLPQVTGAPATDPNGPLVSASAPVSQSDGTPLVYGDLWIDTSDLENYPVIYRWQFANGEDQWVLINNTDQTTENGILFADARWATNGTTDPVNDAIPSIVSLLTSNYLDLDAPNARLYPQGTLLFNTRRSGYNVKQFRTNYFNAVSFPDQVLPQETSAWVTVSGNMANGAPYMGRKAQRAMIVQALKTCVDTSTQLREEDTFFNLMACPNYCELQPNMITLNNDRGQTAYIIGDTPLRLPATAQAIFDWANNTAGATTTGEDGLVTRNTYMGIYYPSGITTDLTGTEVVVPPSHMMLRTIIYNDSVAYPWFAPAGQRRGIIDNASNIGYLDPTTGEFVPDKNRVGLRDIEYQNFINPIAYFTNVGLLNYGNKNSFDSQSALDRTNVARLVCYLRERLAKAVQPFLFEPNDTTTRTQVRGVCQTLLADILSKRGIYDYLVVCDESNNTPARIDRNELWIDIAIEPAKAVEFIYIPIRILNTGELAGLSLNG